MPLLLTASCFSKIQIGFTFLVPAHPGSPRQSGVKRVHVLENTGNNTVNKHQQQYLLYYSHHTDDKYIFTQTGLCISNWVKNSRNLDVTTLLNIYGQ